MNHTDSLGVKQLFTPLRFRCQQVFFISRKFFFRGPVGATRWRKGDLCLIFKPASRTFLPSGKISFSVVRSDVTSSLARTALCAFSTPSSSIFPHKKILRICSMLTVYSINIPKRHRKFLINFFVFSFFALLLFRQSRPSPLPPAGKCAHFLQKHRIPPDLKDRSAAMIFCCPLFGSDTKQKREPEGSLSYISMAIPRRHSFPAAPGDDGGLSPAFPFPRRAEPDDASSGRRSGRSCPPARPR